MFVEIKYVMQLWRANCDAVRYQSYWNVNEGSIEEVDVMSRGKIDSM